MTDRPPPHAPAAESALLGAVLLDYTPTLEACLEHGISEGSFYVPAHRLIYAAMLSLYERDKSVDLATVPEALRTRGELDAAGGAHAINLLVDKCPTSTHADGYIAEVKTKHTLRQLIAACQDVAAKAYSGEDAQQALAYAEKAVESIAHDEPEETVESVWNGIVARIAAAERGEAQEIGLATGIRPFDAVLDGLRKGGVYFLTGEKGAGKTTVVCNIINNVVDAGHTALVFTMEMTMEQLQERMAGVKMGANVTQIIKGNQAVRDEAVQLTGAMMTSGRLLIDAHTDGIDEFCAKVRKAVRKHKVDLVVVDYIQRLRPRKSEGMVADTASISKDVTRLAKRLKVPILCVSMESAGGLYGSRQLDYDAFGTLSVRRVGEDPAPPDYVSNVDVWVDKNRFGPSHLSLPLQIVGRTGQVTEATWAKEEDSG